MVKIRTRAEINKDFFDHQTFEFWVLIVIKFLTSLIFLIDDLTFLLYCMYEFHMGPSEAGLIFCVSALCLFAYGITISGYIIDKIGV